MTACSNSSRQLHLRTVLIRAVKGAGWEVSTVPRAEPFLVIKIPTDNCFDRDICVRGRVYLGVTLDTLQSARLTPGSIGSRLGRRRASPKGVVPLSAKTSPRVNCLIWAGRETIPIHSSVRLAVLMLPSSLPVGPPASNPSTRITDSTS